MPDCNQHICSSDKEAEMIKAALSGKGGGAAIKSREAAVLNNQTPLNAVILGRVSWPLLHRMALAYPEKASGLE